MSAFVGKLPSGKALIPGVALYSASGKTSAALSTNGDFVLQVNQVQRWSAGTANQSIASVGMELDGNVQIRDTAKRIVWQSGTGGHAGAYLEISDTAPWLSIKDAQGVLLWTYYGIPSNGMLRPGQALLMGQEIASPSGKVKAAMTSYGLALRSDVVGAVWDSTGAGRYAMMGNDGNLVVCDDAGTVLWQTDTAGNDGACLVVDDQPTDNWLTVRKGSTAIWTWCPRPKGPYLTAESRLWYGQEIFSLKGTTKLTLTDRGLVLSAIGSMGWTTSWEVLTSSPCAYVRFGGRPELEFSKPGLTVQDLIARTSYQLIGSQKVTTAAPSVVSGAIASSLFALGIIESATQYVVTDGCVVLLGANNRQIGWLGTQFIV